MSSDSCDGVIRAMALMRAMHEIKARKERARPLSERGPAAATRPRRPSTKKDRSDPRFNPLLPEPAPAVVAPLPKESIEPHLPELVVWDAAYSKRVYNPAIFEKIEPSEASDFERTVREAVAIVELQTKQEMTEKIVGKLSQVDEYPAYEYLEEQSQFSLNVFNHDQRDFARGVTNTLKEAPGDQDKASNLLAVLYRYFYNTREIEISAIRRNDQTRDEILNKIVKLSQELPDAYIAIHDIPDKIPKVFLVNHIVFATEGAALLVPKVPDNVVVSNNVLVSAMQDDLSIIAVADSGNGDVIIEAMDKTNYAVALVVGPHESLNRLKRDAEASGFKTVISNNYVNPGMKGTLPGGYFHERAITHLAIFKNITKLPSVRFEDISAGHPFIPAIYKQAQAV